MALRLRYPTGDTDVGIPLPPATLHDVPLEPGPEPGPEPEPEPEPQPEPQPEQCDGTDATAYMEQRGHAGFSGCWPSVAVPVVPSDKCVLEGGGSPLPHTGGPGEHAAALSGLRERERLVLLRERAADQRCGDLDCRERLLHARESAVQRAAAGVRQAEHVLSHSQLFFHRSVTAVRREQAAAAALKSELRLRERRLNDAESRLHMQTQKLTQKQQAATQKQQSSMDATGPLLRPFAAPEQLRTPLSHHGAAPGSDGCAREFGTGTSPILFATRHAEGGILSSPALELSELLDEAADPSAMQPASAAAAAMALADEGRRHLHQLQHMQHTIADRAARTRRAISLLASEHAQG